MKKKQNGPIFQSTLIFIYLTIPINLFLIKKKELKSTLTDNEIKSKTLHEDDLFTIEKLKNDKQELTKLCDKLNQVNIIKRD